MAQQRQLLVCTGFLFVCVILITQFFYLLDWMMLDSVSVVQLEQDGNCCRFQDSEILEYNSSEELFAEYIEFQDPRCECGNERVIIANAHNGVGNRLLFVSSAVWLSMITKKKLRILWDRKSDPIDLSEIFSGEIVRWKADEWMKLRSTVHKYKGFLENYSREKSFAFEFDERFVCTSPLYRAESWMDAIHYDDKVHWLYSDQYFVKAFFKNIYFKEWMGRIFPKSNYFHEFMKFVVKEPSQRIVSYVNAFRAKYEAHDPVWIGIHIRTELWDSHSTASKYAISAREIAASFKLNRTIIFFISSDNADIANTVENYLVTSKSLSSSEFVVHYSTHKYVRNSENAALNAVAELWILANCDRLVLTYKSTFSMVAATWKFLPSVVVSMQSVFNVQILDPCYQSRPTFCGVILDDYNNTGGFCPF
jgi:hypothetical protein